MPDSARTRVPAVRIGESIAAELRHRILRGDFAAGTLLPKQDDLVEEFGVSPPSLREALRILETERLIAIRRGKFGGAEIQLPNAASAGYSIGLALAADRVHLGDLAEGLLQLEPLCVSLCATNPGRARLVERLRENMAEAESLIDDEVAFTHTAREFHQLIVDFMGNRTLRLVLSSLVSLWSAQEEAWAESLTRAGEYFSVEARREVLRAHLSVLEDIERGDGESAERHARQHLAATQELFLSRFNDQVVDVTSIKGRNGYRSAIARGGRVT